MMGSDAPQPIKGPEFDKLKTQADIDGPLVDYRQGHHGRAAWRRAASRRQDPRLKITRKDGQSQELFLDANTGLE